MNSRLKWFNWRFRFYRIHVFTGLTAVVFLLFMAVSGVLINHQEELGLLDVEIPDHYLPDNYRPDYRTGTMRLNVIITDLHSGRILGDNGHWVSDGIALLMIVSLLSGGISYLIRQRLMHSAPKEPPSGNPVQGKKLLPSEAGQQEQEEVAVGNRTG